MWKWKLFKLYSFMVFNVVVSLFAVVLIVMSFVPVIAAQPLPKQVEIEDLERRVAGFESLNLDHRLTVIETILKEDQDNEWKSSATGIGTGLLIVHTAYREVRKRIQDEDKD